MYTWKGEPLSALCLIRESSAFTIWFDGERTAFELSIEGHGEFHRGLCHFASALLSAVRAAIQF